MKAKLRINKNGITVHIGMYPELKNRLELSPNAFPPLRKFLTLDKDINISDNAASIFVAWINQEFNKFKEGEE